MSDKEVIEHGWEDPLADRTYLPTDVGSLEKSGKSSPNNNSGFKTLPKTADRLRLERLRLQQIEAEEEFSYQFKRLELERQRSRAKFENEIAQLESVDQLSGRKVDDEVVISRNLNARFDNISLSDVIHKLDLPKIELPYFDGDSSMYHYFIREFETQVESRVKEDSQRLSYLLHYCKGRAKRAISGCVMLPVSQGYSNARNILSNMFGQAHVVAKSLIDKLTTGKPIKNTSDDLWELSIEMQNCHTTLNQMSYVCDLNSHVTIEKVARRLPHELQQRWVERASEIYEHEREPSFQDLIDFVVKRARVAGCRYSYMLASCNEQPRASSSGSSISKTRDNFAKRAFNSTLTKSVDKCSLCDLDHTLEDCKVFLSMNVGTRRRFVARNKRCFICLSLGHMASQCKVTKRCDRLGCGETHHKLLHKDKINSSPTVNYTENIHQPKNPNRTISMGIVAIKVIGPSDSRQTYALIDNGSDSTFISQRLTQKLNMHGEDASIAIKTLNSVRSERSSKVSFVLEPVDGSCQVQVDQAFTMRKLDLGVGCPFSAERLKRWRHLEDIDLVNIGPIEIDLLIGCNVPEAHWSLDQRVGNRDQPFAVKTALGWVLFGPTECTDPSNGSTCLLSSCHVIERQISNLFNNEFQDVSEHQSLSIEDSEAVKQVSSSICLRDGHFVIGLPWKVNRSSLPDNHAIAYRRLMMLRRRFISDSDLYAKYRDLMQRHFDLGYAVPAPECLSDASTKWYLPHHPVLNAKKPGKVRIVFDCAAKHLGISLNDCLLQGPNMVQNLVAILTRFRAGKFALTGDIREMFLQVKIPDEDRDVMRFLWWDQGDIAKPVKEFQLTVHPFGAVSSPFCASFALQQCAGLDHGNISDGVVNALQNNFYVDDCLVSCDYEATLSELRKELTNLLSMAGFQLTKWMSNSREVLRSIPTDDCATPIVDLGFQDLPVERTLGMQWDAQSDTFKFDVHLPSRPSTRRGILSCVSSLYDPLGLVSPVLLPAKQILQELCRLKYGWDDPIDEDIDKSWNHWLSSMEQLRKLRIPRCLKPPELKSNIAPELHLFSDASECGYGVAAYIRYESNEDYYRCTLLLGKSRVAPLKFVSIPRLELNAAVLAVKVCNLIKRENLVQPSRIYYWTDSMTVLYYLANTSTRYATFVANRVTFILDHSEKDQWLFVKGSDNPADFASRGLPPDDPRFQLWLNGPAFLRSPFKPFELPARSGIPEGCELKRVRVSRLTYPNNQLGNLLTHYSSWHKLRKAVVWLVRFKTYLSVIYGVRPNSFVSLGPVKLHEVERATKDIIYLVQQESFSSELEELGKHGKCKRLSKLNPVLCEGILVIGSRLERLSRSTWNPCRPILPSKHKVTELIIAYYHVLEGHAGLQQVLNTVRRYFWIIKGVGTTKRVLRNCLRCKYLNARPVQQQMACLPDCRITPGVCAFESSGVDYFGPLIVQQGRSNVKRWGCLFTCMRTRAVHIEVVHTLSTDSFLMALLRFISRRGCPRELFSDNGSNFVGADAELRREFKVLSQEKISDMLLSRGIQWHFQPPDSSHRGGVWERMIRSVRKILRSISNEQVMRDEVLMTLLAEAERILNNRPLVPVYDDSRDVAALTPNDLLLLKSVDSISTDTSLDVRRYTKWWKQACYLSNVFWRRWIKEYLPTLEQRQKWQFPERNLKVGDVVLVTNETTPRDNWLLGRVVATYPSDDGLVRKVDITTKKGMLHRDVRKVCLLEGDMDCDV